MDKHTCECLAIDVAGSIICKRVVEVLSTPISVHGVPLYMRSGNCLEFVSRAIFEWSTQADIATALSGHGKPEQNSVDESFTGNFREDCLSLEGFRSLNEASFIIEGWRRHYNAVRPHSSMKYMTPHEFKLHNSVQPNRAEPSYRKEWLNRAKQVSRMAQVECRSSARRPSRVTSTFSQTGNVR